MKTFEKNDNNFLCRVCGHNVPTLKYSSRDHCTKCLCSIHVDINPGDRANSCLGTLVPV
ncbi:MAG: RNHCP domain-containing protein, partial [Clostridia bacterium]|nr:RNHCP domain-containing protein [Clostridia bacterium]